MTIGTLRKAGTGVRWFSEPRLARLLCLELGRLAKTPPCVTERPPRPHPPYAVAASSLQRSRHGDKAHTLLRPRRKAQEVVEEPRREVVVLWRQMEAI